jgi:hypothetical protein
VYEYYYTVSQIIISEDGTVAEGVPANANTNLSNGALGYFGVFTVRQDSIIAR